MIKFIRQHFKPYLGQCIYTLCLISLALTPLNETIAQEHNSSVANGAGQVTGGVYTGYVSIGETATDVVSGGDIIASSGLILRETTVQELKFPVTGNVYLNDQSPVFIGRATIFKEEQNGSMVEYLDYDLTPQGYFHFFVPEGNYTVRVIADEQQYPTAFVTYFGDKILHDEALSFSVTGDSFKNDIVLQLEPDVQPLEVNETVNINGQLYEDQTNSGKASLKLLKKASADSEPLSDTYIYLIDKESGEIFYYTKTDMNGNFTFSNIQYRTYYLSIDYPGIPDNTSPIELDVTNDTTEEINVIAEVSSAGINSEVSVNTAIEDEEFNSLSQSIGIYPNPVRDVLNVFISSIETTQTPDWSIYSLTGKTLMQGKIQQERTPINVSALQPGLYILRVEFDTNTSIVRKITIE
ncbi:T9SS type A sorting domain-containing protein [Carboxylicivirga sp. M1479]|uniref:T9SS type A sorting domain-containing protein n=1 Tax=Carboxylicivirga sp. M1479 TaxID=2594476 RepID=UPI0011783F8C|nr:T9SS type A sorting domain-containing protein [Carboxylicivirga sp. M1479]TRX61914.1 T9SS type A sorting domain-containing protein [Carboxylicivirga sp. M1479]